MLTSRTKEIIVQILEADAYITIQQIADEIKVSSRTVLRELDAVETWFLQQKVPFRKKKGRGLKVEVSTTIRERLLTTLYSEKEISSIHHRSARLFLKPNYLK